jgi:signal transduction histidine kinase/ligand-binding sensor domain-containing protein
LYIYLFVLVVILFSNPFPGLNFKNQHMKKNTGWFLLFYVFAIYTGNAFSQQVNFRHYSVKEGISQSEIKCIFQDSEGFIWFGTQNGLNQFNGYTFQKYFGDPADNTSISNSWIFGITEDADGYLWFATKRGINRFDKKTNRFTQVNHRLPNSLVNDQFVYGITSDDSCIYANTPPALSVYNYKTGKLKTFNNRFGYDGILFDIGFPILRSHEGLIWSGSLHGLSCFNPRTSQFVNYNHNPEDPNSISNNHVTALFEDQEGNILVGTESGFNILQKKANRFIRWFHDDKNPNSISNNFIRSIVQDHSGVIWIGTEEGGLNQVTVNRNEEPVNFIHFRSKPDNPGYISHDIVYSLCEDQSHNLWIGTIAGMDKLDLKKKKFARYKKTEDPRSIDLLDNVIGSLFVEPNGRLWVGNWNKGLNIIDRNTLKVEHYSTSRNGKFHLPGNNVHVIYRDRQSTIWLGTRNGVCVYDNKTGSFIPFESYFGIEDSGYFDNNRVYCIVEDSGGNIWIGTGNGVFRMNLRTRQTRIIQANNSGRLAISNNLVYSIMEDKERLIWIATSNGLDCYVPQKDRIVHYLRNPESRSTLSDNYTISLCEDFKRNIWIGTSTGVNRFNKADSTFTCFSMKDGLPSNIIYDILEDNRHNLWFTTGNGLALYDAATGRIRPYTLEDGVQGMEFNIKAVCKGPGGELFFGGMDGFISFFPDSLRDNDFQAPVKITSFEKETNEVRSRLGVYEKTIYLSYRDYSFTIEFAALDYSDPLKNQYAYQMEPLSDKWINIGNMRFVHFTNLPPGNYTFRVKGTNSDGLLSNSVASLKIFIDPPWWKSKLARLIYLLMLIAAVIMIIRLRVKKLVTEKKVLEQKIQERTEEIVRQKDKLDALNSTKDRFFSILAHDLKTPFSSLYSMSASLNENYDTLDDSDKRTGLNKIYKLADLIGKLIENLLTWSSTQRGNIVFSPLAFNLSKLVEVNVNLHKITAHEKKITLRNAVKDGFQAFGDTEMINTVLRNLISNAIKFTPEKKTVTVSVKEDGDFFEVVVADKGMGISPENIQKLFRIDLKYKTTGTAGETGTGLGLVLCKEFVEKNGGKIWCESQEHIGTTFHFTIPVFRSTHLR